MTQLGVGDLFSFTGLNAVTVCWKGSSLPSRKPTQETSAAALLPEGFNHVCSPERLLQSSFHCSVRVCACRVMFYCVSVFMLRLLVLRLLLVSMPLCTYPSQPLIKINSLTGELWVLNRRKLEHSVHSGEKMLRVHVTAFYKKQIKWKYRSEWETSRVIKRCDFISVLV